MTEQYRISLDIYGGPMDLLLYLVQKSEVDIFDVNISEVVDQYIKYVEALKEIDIDSAGEFLALAARLLQIKSRMLLPRPATEGADEELIDPREELVKELLEYRQFKERALALEERIKVEGQKFSPPGLALAETEAQEIELESVSVWDLMLAFHKVTKDLGLKFAEKAVFSSKPVSEYITELLAKVSCSPESTRSFSSVFEGSADIATVIGIFLAVLECVRLGSLRVYQEKEFSEIYLFFVPESERRKPWTEVHGLPAADSNPDAFTAPDSAEQYGNHHAGRCGDDSEDARQNEGSTR